MRAEEDAAEQPISAEERHDEVVAAYHRTAFRVQLHDHRRIRIELAIDPHVREVQRCCGLAGKHNVDGAFALREHHRFSHRA